MGSLLKQKEALTKEINQINGYVCRKGKAAGVATPCNDFVVELVSEAEARRSLPAFDPNLARMRACLERLAPPARQAS